ncbi:MAG: hypothetical protein V4569_19005, partial [Pseudomonadota bacterium]
MQSPHEVDAGFRRRQVYSLAPCTLARHECAAPRMKHNFIETTMSYLSYVSQKGDTAWDTYISQVDRVLPYLGNLARWS